MTDMRVGLYLPQIGATARADRIVELARAAESGGFDSLWALDHVVLRDDYESRYPYSPDGRLAVPARADFLEALTLLTWVAAITERVELGTAVLVLPMRAPVLHAKIMASLDHLAGGRLILGAGLGWFREEFHALSMPFDRRGARFEEYLEVLRQLWTREVADFKGEFYDASGWACHPQPPRPIPIWLGGNSPQQLRRVGRLADGWLANPAMLPTLAEDFDRAREAAVAAGRSPDALRLAINRVTVIARDRLTEAADTLAGLKERGVHHAIASVDARDPDPTSLLEEFAEAHLPSIQG